jgi:pimeloyl-ACP methyl ester carboxylesterase
MAGMPQATVNGATIHYQDKGAGRPVVLIHGFPLDGRVWAGQVDVLARTYRVIVPDLHGFGQSKASRPSTMASMVEDLRALCRQLGALPCAAAGLSMGGYVLLQWEKTCPTDVDAIILVDTKPDADTTEARQGRDKMIQQAASGGATAVADAMLPKMLAPEALSRDPGLVRRLRDLMESQSPQAIQWALAAMRDRDDFNAELPNIADPTLLIFGRHDAITPPAIGERLQRAIPRAQLQVIEQAGHMAPLEQPDAVAQAMLTFLDRCY